MQHSKEKNIGKKEGLLITFEGPDGSGKTTQIQLLKEYFKDNGYEVINTREPGGTEISEKIRDIILDNKNSNMYSMCEALLYAASRAQLVNEVIKPALKSGKIVICDRFVHSSIVYQGIGRNLGIDRIKQINEAALDGLEADLVFLMKISYEEGLIRKSKQKSLDRLENSGDEFHKRVYDGYMELENQYSNIIGIDATKNKDEIHREIKEIIKNRLK